MTTTEGLVQLYTTHYGTNLQMNLQQQSSRLRGKVTEGFYVGKQASPVDYAAPVSMRAPAGRFAPINRTDTNYSRRWVTPVDKELAQLVDKFDKLKTLEDPTSVLNRGSAAAVAREWDDRIISAVFGTAQTSTTDGSTLTAETWAQAQNTLTGSNTGLTIADDFGNGSTTIGMTVDKLIEARRLFRHYHVLDEEMQPGDLTLIIGAQQEADMLKLTEVVSREFNDRPVLVDGVITRFLGWNVIVSERLNFGADPVSSHSNCRSCIAFVKTGLHLGVWLDMENDISKQTQLSGQPWQLYTAMSSGATRLEPGRVLQISCGNDTTGGDTI